MQGAPFPFSGPIEGVRFHRLATQSSPAQSASWENLPLGAPWIAAGFEQSGVQIPPRRPDVALRPIRGHFDLMATATERSDGFHSDPRLDADEIGSADVRSEESGKMLAAEFGGLDRVLRGHTEHGSIEKELQLPLILLIAAHTA